MLPSVIGGPAGAWASFQRAHCNRIFDEYLSKVFCRLSLGLRLICKQHERFALFVADSERETIR
jgi:hypothetical protein